MADPVRAEAPARGSSSRQTALTLGALRYPNFRVYWFSGLSFVLGFQVLRVALAWVVYDLTDSPVYLGALGGVMAAGSLSVALLGGVAADRVDRRLLLIGTQSVMTGVVLALVVLASAGSLAAWHLLAGAAVIGVVNGIDQPTRTAIIPSLIGDRRDLMNALALGSAIWQGTRIFGPALGGILLEAVGTSATFGVVAVGFLGGTVLLIRLRVPSLERQARSVLRELAEGLAFIARHGLFASLIGLTFVDSFFGIAYIYLLPIFARDILGAGASGMGVLMGASAVGALAGTMVAAFLIRGRWPRALLLGGAGVFGLAIIVFGLSGWLALSLGALLLSGAANSLSMITNQTILQAAVPEELRGRVMGVFSLTYSMIPLGGLQAGVVASYLGAPLAVALGGGVVVVFTLFLASRPGLGHRVLEAAAAHR